MVADGLRRIVVGFFLVALVGSNIAWHKAYKNKYPVLNNTRVGEEEGTRIIERILMRRAEATDYKEYCPDLPRRMWRIQAMMGLDIRTIPTIANIEGGTVSKTMQKAKNLCGFAINEKIIVYDDWDYAIYKACDLVRRTNTNDVRVLAQRWCPPNWEQWSDNFRIIYTWSLRKEAEEKNGKANQGTKSVQGRRW